MFPAVGYGAEKKIKSHSATSTTVLTIETLRNLTYTDISTEPVTLHNGMFEGKPFIAGGSSRLKAELLNTRMLTGDLNGDGAPEAIAFLSVTSGGSANELYLAVVAPTSTGFANTSTILLGDRVSVRSARIENGKIFITLLQAGPKDSMSNPGELMPRSWILERKGLVEQPNRKKIDRLTLTTLSGVEWVLQGEESPEVTFLLERNQIRGFSGCNRYLGVAETTSVPGQLSLKVSKATKHNCPPSVARKEDIYFSALRKVDRYGFMAGDLTLQVNKGDGHFEILRFTPRMREK